MFVVGAFMAFFLAGALWYLIGIGDAILFRERVQDGTDAVAFAAAVTNARSMNIIVSLNIVLAVLLGVLVMLKLLLFILSMVQVALLACAWMLPWCGAALTAVTEVRSVVEEVKEGYELIYEPLHTAVSGLQTVVQHGGPFVAEVASWHAAEPYKPDVKYGVYVGNALTGLPVRDGDKNVVCGRVSETIGEYVLSLFVIGFIKDMLRGPVTGGVEAFCREGNQDQLRQMGGKAIDETAQKEAQERCDFQHGFAESINAIRSGPARGSTVTQGHLDAIATWESEYVEGLENGDAGLPPPLKGVPHPDLEGHPCFDRYAGKGLFNELERSGPRLPQRAATFIVKGPAAGCALGRSKDECVKVEKQAILDEAMESAKDAFGNTEAKTEPPIPKEIDDTVEGARNGGSAFQLYGLVVTNTGRVESKSPAVAVAAAGNARPGTMSKLTGQSIARAEFYYSEGRPWDEISVDSMWNLKWRARLRRVDLETLVGDDGAEVLEAVNDALKTIGEAIPDSDFNDAIEFLTDTDAISKKSAERARHQRDVANSGNASGWKWLEHGPIH